MGKSMMQWRMGFGSCAALWVIAATACGGGDSVAPSTGSVQISTATSGPEPDSDGYTVSLDGGTPTAIAVAGSLQLETLEPGNHSIHLAGLAGNCSADGDNPRSFTISGGAATTVSFAITCRATTGTLQLTASTSGPSPDPDGYVVSLNGSDNSPIGASSGATLGPLTAGIHTVGLNGVAANCQVQGDNPRPLTIVPGESTTAAFIVVCTAAPASAGSIHIKTATSGVDPDPDGYAVALDGGATQPIGATATATLINVAAGAHTVRLSGLAGNCRVAASNPRQVAVSAGLLAEVQFAITCTAAVGSVEVTTTTTGASPDPDGYTVMLDHSTPQTIPVTGLLTLSGVALGAHQVTLGGLAPNCTVSGDNPRAVTVSIGVMTKIGYSIECRAPAGSRIAWEKGNGTDVHYGTEINVMNSDGSGHSPVGGDGAGSTEGFDWSPDGRRIAYSRGRLWDFEEPVFVGPDIYIMNSDGSGRTDPLSAGIRPRWSNDGRKVAFAGRERNGLYVMNADGTRRRRLSAGFVNGHRWSPVGNKIVFVKSSGTADEDIDIYVIDGDGTGQTRLTQSPENGKRDANHDPRWSPDGKSITFWRFRNDGSGPQGVVDIFLMSADGSNQTNLTNTAAVDERFSSWSPDGRKIAFVSQNQSSNGSELSVMSFDGTSRTTLTTGRRVGTFDWSPDGNKIVFTGAGIEDGAQTIWVMNADGTGQVQLTTSDSGTEDFNPQWSR